MMAMTLSPFWCLYPEYPMPSPLFWPRCSSRRHGVRWCQDVSLPPDGEHWRGTPARATHHRPIWQRLCTRSYSEWPVSRWRLSARASTSIASRCRAPSWVATRRGLSKPVSSSPPLKTGLAAFTAPGLAPAILLRDSRAPRSVPSHFLSIHSAFPVDSLRVR